MLLAADAFTLSGWGQLGQLGVAGLVAVGALFVLRWTDSHQRTWLSTANAHISALEADIKELRAQHALCEWRTQILLGVARHAGLDIPAEYWAGPPVPGT